ncbi:MAG: MMPL family transporter [Verrucomicrobiota bacterium]|nr:MMPL family transporter [Verrucomicrobiota bacterium]
MIKSRNPFVRFPGFFFSIFLVVILGLIWQSTKISIDADPMTLLESDRRHLETYERISSFLNDDTALVISIESDLIFTESGFELIRNISNSISNQDGLVDVKSLTHSYKPVRKGLSFNMEPFVPTGKLTEKQIDEIRDFSINHPLVRNIMVSSDGKVTLITATYKRDLNTSLLRDTFRKETETILAPFNSPEFQVKVIALPFITEELSDTFIHDLKLVIPTTGLCILIIVGLTFRSIKCMVLLLFSEALLVGALPGILRLAGFTLTPYNILLLPLLASINLTLLTHQLTSLLKTDQNLNLNDRFDLMLKTVFRPSLFASITTAIGLGSLAICEVSQVKNFGLAGMVGICTIFIWGFGPGLALLKLGCIAWPNTLQTETNKYNKTKSFFNSLGQVTIEHRWYAAVLTVLILLPTLFAVKQLNIDVRAIQFLSPKSHTRQMAEMIDTRMGGINVVQMDFKTNKPSGINKIEFLRKLQEVQDFAEATGRFSSTYSYASLMAIMNSVWIGDNAVKLSLPTSPITLRIFVLALKATNYPFLQALSDETQQTAHLILRTTDMPSNEFVALLESIETKANEIMPQDITVEAQAGLHTVLKADQDIVNAQLGSLSITLVAMFCVMAALWRSFRFSAIALATGLGPIAVLTIIGALFQIPLNSVTVMVGAIALGIGIDDAVHLITHWLNAKQDGITENEALILSLEAKGPAILCTSLILIGFSLSLLWMSFPPVIHFGWLSATAYITALAAALWILPSLLVTKRKS